MDAKFVCQTVGVAQTFPHIQQLGKQDLTSEQTTFNFGQQNIQALSVSGTREWQGKFVGTSSKGKKPSKRVWNKELILPFRRNWCGLFTKRKNEKIHSNLKERNSLALAPLLLPLACLLAPTLPSAPSVSFLALEPALLAMPAGCRAASLQIEDACRCRAASLRIEAASSTTRHWIPHALPMPSTCTSPSLLGRQP
jgi:hypothetical protein